MKNITYWHETEFECSLRSNYSNRASSPSTRVQIAFTLVELLVVIAIIALLASLLLPGLSRASSAAKSVHCRNNLRQIAIANIMYVNDFGSFPHHIEKALFWHDRLQPYLQPGWNGVYAEKAPGTPWRRHEIGPPHWKEGVHRCTGLRGPGRYSFQDWTEGGGTIVGLTLWTYPEGDYSINDLAAGTPNSGMAGAKESEVAVPSQLLAFGDAILYSADIRSRFSYTRFGSYSGRDDDIMDLRQARRDQASRHNGKFNVAFVDGHVQSMKTNELFGPSEASLRLWNRDNLPKKRGN